MSLMAAAIQGLPPLPKSLSGFLSFNRESLSREAGLRASHNMAAHHSNSSSSEENRPKRTPPTPVSDPWSDVPASLKPDCVQFSSSSVIATEGHLDKRVRLPCPPGSLEKNLAILRKEMVDLRKLDVSLLNQLWLLNEQIKMVRQENAFQKDIKEEETHWERESDADSDDLYTDPIPPTPPQRTYQSSLLQAYQLTGFQRQQQQRRSNHE